MLAEEGLALREQGKDDAALAKFQEAYRIEPGPRVLAQIALAEQALGHWVDAENHLKSALLASSDPWIAQHREQLEQVLSVIANELGSLEIRCNVVGAQVRVAGRPVGQTPLPSHLRVAESVLSIELSAAGYYPLKQSVTIRQGVLNRADVVLVPLTDAVQLGTDEPVRSSAMTREHGRWYRSPWLWSAVGAVVTGAVVGTTLALRGDDSIVTTPSQGGSLGVELSGPRRTAR